MPRSAYPMGAHYLPSPHRGFHALKTLLDDLGVVLGHDAGGRPDYDPTVICPSPTERHYYLGRWSEGIYPSEGQTAQEAEQWSRWQAHLLTLDERRGHDGRRLFDLPVHHSSIELRHLDSISMATYLDHLDLTSWRLRWTVDYACRDDYGCSLDQTSAFAGLHHYLSRGLEERHERVILAWPNGNQALVDRMFATGDPAQRHCNHAVVRINPDSGDVIARDLQTQSFHRFRAQTILWAAPRFILPFVLTTHDALPHKSLTYAPWWVANIETGQPPGGVGAPLAWDNVDVHADHLGYVVANHNESLIQTHQPGSVLSLYSPMLGEPTTQRQQLLATTPEQWHIAITQALTEMHPGWDPQIRRIHVTRWGHGMIRPTPGLLFGSQLAQAKQRIGRVIPCAADIGGLALFEQAFCHGVVAAEQALTDLGQVTQTVVQPNTASS